MRGAAPSLQFGYSHDPDGDVALMLTGLLAELFANAPRWTFEWKLSSVSCGALAVTPPAIAVVVPGVVRQWRCTGTAYAGDATPMDHASASAAAMMTGRMGASSFFASS